MADWMKIEKTLPDKLEVLQLAGMLNLSEDEVVGKLFRFWCWVDDNLKDCNAHGVTFVTLDRIANCKNFAAGLVKVGWLEGREGRLSIPHFDRHFGQSAKARAVTNKRVRAHREARKNTPETCNAPSVTNVTPKALPEEKRIYNNTKGSSRNTVDIGAGGESAPPSPMQNEGEPGGFAAWLAVITASVRAFREARALHPEVEAAAKAAYARFPRAVEYAELLRAYYESRDQEMGRGRRCWKPQSSQFFDCLEDVIFKHALPWQGWSGWKPTSKRKPAATKTPPPVEAMSEAERAAAFAELRNEAGLGEATDGN